MKLEIWAEKRQHVKAAGLFNTGKLYHEAAKQYHKAGMTSKALQTLYSGKVFDQLVRDLHRYAVLQSRNISKLTDIGIAMISRMENEWSMLANATSSCASPIPR